MLAAKTAVAAAVAWYLAPAVPFADAEYSYYAPMGVLVSMYPTVADSARAGVQALGGLALGIVLGFGGLAAVTAGAPAVAAIALVIGAGVALGGIQGLGAGRDWIAIAGLFVLLLGGGHADEFSLSYLLTMAFGVLVGIAANYLLLPPLYLREAGAQLTVLRERLALSLERLADDVEAGGVDPERLDRESDELASLAGAVAAGVGEAGRSVRGNPRGRRRATEQEQNDRAWSSLERATLLTREVTEVLARRPQVTQEGGRGRDRQLSAALRDCGDLLAAGASADAMTDAADRASAAVTRYARAVVAQTDDTAQPDSAFAVAGHLSRIVQLCGPAEVRG
ncbi:FUSC family protein [Microbacterium sp. zg-Y818]|uniref:FUSC family protein n=1 Tax=unclassified Microbacterium TaxID=2609290 RepID=UPI00214C3252|nr:MULTISPECIES: FUSC family protein [unclassified Microbacterium]MCR2801862.1 FUSC family protein [Microbacterium sp. zg.Y818]WIM22878.1 FUSC family protein [Microbacterium sp. zg-Y818]